MTTHLPSLMRALLFCLGSALGLAAHADVYTWRGADGSVQYGDVPPPNAIDVRRLHTPASPPSDGEARRALADKELQAKKRRLDAEEAAAQAEKEKLAAEDKARNCSQSKNYLRALESGERISRLQDNGERVYLDDQMRTQETAAARRAVDAWCK